MYFEAGNGIIKGMEKFKKVANKVAGKTAEAGPSEGVGGGELKMAEAGEAFSYDFRGKTVLDIGSSTGGFTELALRLGASRVVAVEKGTKQMKAPLRFDERIDLYEKMDIFEFRVPEGASGGFDTILADVSFVSLRKVLAYARKNLASQKTDFLVMLKPQFEASERQLVRGVVKNEKMRREIMRGFEEWLRGNGFLILKKRDNETVGKVGGNRERFYWLKLAK